MTGPASADGLAVIVLAKAPVPGLAKTRLCPPATAEQAATLASAALLDTLDAVGSMRGAHPVVALTGDLADAVDAAGLGAVLDRMTVLAQRGDSLGERIAAAHADTAALHPGSPSMQIGMDTPQITAGLLEDCARRLRAPGTDAVLGTAVDGGWWLLGLRDPRHAGLLAAVPTSRPDTGAATLRALRSAGLRVTLGPELTDVDTAAEAVEVAATIPGSRFAAAVDSLTTASPA